MLTDNNITTTPKQKVNEYIRRGDLEEALEYIENVKDEDEKEELLFTITHILTTTPSPISVRPKHIKIRNKDNLLDEIVKKVKSLPQDYFCPMGSEILAQIAQFYIKTDIEKAKSIAYNIKDTSTRWNTFQQITRALVEKKDIDGVLNTVRFCGEAEEKSKILTQLAILLALDGDIHNAQKIIEKIDDMYHYSRAIRRTALALAKNNEIDKAFEILKQEYNTIDYIITLEEILWEATQHYKKVIKKAQKIKHWQIRNDIISKVVEILDEAGKHNEAKDVIKLIDSQYYLSKALVEIAKTQEDFISALESIEKIEDYYNISKMLDLFASCVYNSITISNSEKKMLLQNAIDAAEKMHDEYFRDTTKTWIEIKLKIIIDKMKQEL